MKNLSEKSKFIFLQPSGSRAQIENALNKISPKSYAEENWSQKFYAILGMWLFPACIAVLSCVGLGEIFNSFLPAWLSYVISGILVVLIEIGQAAFGRPLMKRIVRKQIISAGMIGRVLGFTFLSIGIGALSFYMVILNNEKNTILENRQTVINATDSINKSYERKNAVLLSQLLNLEKNKQRRFKGLLMPEEQKLQSEINRQLSKNDSLQKTEKQNIAVLYPTQEQPSNWNFSPDNFIKILASIFAVLILGFLTIYSHYIDFKHARGIEQEMNNLLNIGESEISINENVSINRIAEQYYETAINLPGYSEFLKLAPAAKHEQHTIQSHETEKNPIGFLAINENRKNENRVCLFCGSSYESNHKKQIYCSEACRIASYEKRTGRKLNFKKKEQ